MSSISFPTFINLKCTAHQARKITSDYSIKGTYLLVVSTGKYNVYLILQKYEDPAQKTKYLPCHVLNINKNPISTRCYTDANNNTRATYLSQIKIV